MTIVLPAKERSPLCSDNAVFEGVRSARDRYSGSRIETDLARLADCGNEQTTVQEQRLRATVSNDRTIEVFSLFAHQDRRFDRLCPPRGNPRGEEAQR